LEFAHTTGADQHGGYGGGDPLAEKMINYASTHE
jgi:hypothetical protein